MGLALFTLGLAVALGLSTAAAGAADRERAGRLAPGGAWQALERGAYQESLGLFERATSRRPGDAKAWIGLALSARGLQQDARAIEALEAALQTNPGLIDAHRLAGRWYGELDRADLAIPHFEAALRQAPNAVQIQSELRQARQSREQDARLSRLSRAQVVVKFEPGLDAAAASRLAEELETAAVAIQEALGYQPTVPVVAILHGRDEGARPDWAEGLFDGRLHVTMAQLHQSRTRLQAYLRHEYTHAVIHRISQGRAPTWLDEGIAQYLERPASAKPVARLVAPDEPIFLGAMQGDFAGLPQAEARRRYAESLRATTLLINAHGVMGLRRWLETLTVSKDLAQAYERVFDRPYPTLIMP